MSLENLGDESGICKVLGYEKAVPGGFDFSDGGFSVFEINKDGTIKQIAFLRKVTNIYCLNKVDGFVLAQLVGATEPRHPNSQAPMSIVDWNDESGVCKVLGHEKSVPKSIQFSD